VQRCKKKILAIEESVSKNTIRVLDCEEILGREERSRSGDCKLRKLFSASLNPSQEWIGYGMSYRVHA